MLESRNSYGWGYTGSSKKGYEWHFQPDEKDPCYAEGCPFVGTLVSGDVFSTEEKAIKEGMKWLRSTKGKRSGVITAIKSRPLRFEY